MFMEPFGDRSHSEAVVITCRHSPLGFGGILCKRREQKKKKNKYFRSNEIREGPPRSRREAAWAAEGE